jgi:hypothetical protein
MYAGEPRARFTQKSGDRVGALRGFGRQELQRDRLVE